MALWRCGEEANGEGLLSGSMRGLPPTTSFRSASLWNRLQEPSCRGKKVWPTLKATKKKKFFTHMDLIDAHVSCGSSYIRQTLLNKKPYFVHISIRVFQFVFRLYTYPLIIM